MGPVHRARLGRVRERLAAAGADVLLVSHLPNVYYLCAFTGSSGALLVEPHTATLFTDGRYSIQAREEVCATRVVTSRAGGLAATALHLAGRGRLIARFEANSLSVSELARLKKAAGRAVTWQGTAGLVESLRRVKDEDEMARLREAARLGSRVFEEVLALVKPGVRESDLAAEIEFRMRRLGARGPAFETIVASGPRTALPHAQPTEKKVRKNELVVLDLGAILRHYCCDLTRTVYVGRAPARVRAWYQAVLDAQEAALHAAQAGRQAGQVDAAARRVLRRARLERRFVHSTGHGLGLEVHEEPRLARGQKGLLEAGNVVTIEPGVYIEGAGGIRIEDDVLLQPQGNELLTCATREFLQL